MMEKTIKALLLLASFTLFSNAYAVNWGITASYNIGDIEDDDDDVEIDGDNDFFSVGVTLDTGDVNRIFNYRGTLSYIDGELDGDVEVDTVFGPRKGRFESDYSGFSVDNTFGFRVGGNATKRIWIGPSIDLQFLDFDGSSGDDDDGFSLTAGGTAGIDFYPETGNLFSLATGFRIGSLYIDTDENGGDDVDADTTSFFVRGTVFFTRPQR